MEEEDQQDPSVVNFIPCMRFVKRGVAKEQPHKVRKKHKIILFFIRINSVYD